MNKIEGYAVYQQNYESLHRTETEKPQGIDKSSYVEPAATYERTSGVGGANQSVKLSDKAKDLLKELQQKYGNMDIMVAKTNSDEEASAIMARGTKEYSLLIDPDELERMANDEDYKNKQLEALESATSNLDQLKEQLKDSLGEDAKEVARIGISIDADGNQKYFAYLEKMSEAMDKRIEARRAANAEAAEKKKEADSVKLKEQIKEINNFDEIAAEDTVEVKFARHAFLTADNEVDLLESVTGFDWENYTDMFLPIRVQKLDLSV